MYPGAHGTIWIFQVSWYSSWNVRCRVSSKTFEDLVCPNEMNNTWHLWPFIIIQRFIALLHALEINWTFEALLSQNYAGKINPSSYETECETLGECISHHTFWLYMIGVIIRFRVQDELGLFPTVPKIDIHLIRFI